jgi:DNA-binding CsgD family transcriptional regulator
MADKDGSADLIAAIYDTILDPTRWDEITGRIVARTNSVSGSLAIQRGNSFELAAAHNMDPFYLEAYAKNWATNNPLELFKRSVPRGSLKTYTKVTQTDSFKASAYFNEFIRPQGWGDGVVACLDRGPASAGYFGIIRPPDRIWIEAQHWHLLETLVPHLQRALAVNRLFSYFLATADSLGQAFATAGFAVFLVTEDCRILFANPKAEELLRRRVGVLHGQGRLSAKDRTVSEHLQALVREGSNPMRGGGECGGTLVLRDANITRPLIAHVIPFAPVRTLAIIDCERPAAAVFVVDPGADLIGRVRLFATRFGLTVAETRVLAEIISGSGIQAAAEKLKMAEGTARTHAKHILAKTGTTRQTALIRKFFEESLPGFSSGC